MRIAATVIALSALFFAAPASAQGYGLGSGPKVGEIEIKAYQKIPKVKIAVQLTSDTHLARELRRQVMVRLSQRGNQVGFSGGNVMRIACGSTIRRKDCTGDSPSTCAASRCPFGTAWMPAR